MKTSLILASLTAALLLGFYTNSPAPQTGQAIAAETAATMADKTAISKTQNAPEPERPRAQQAPPAAQKPLAPNRAAPPISTQFSYSIDGTQTYARNVRGSLNGYSVTETATDAALFMRVFEKNGHVLAAFNYSPSVIPIRDANAKAPASGAYTVTIMRGGAVLGQVSIQTHHAGQEWVWMNGPLKYLRTPMETGQYPRHEWQQIYDPFSSSKTLIKDTLDLKDWTSTPAPYVPLSVGRNIPNWRATGKHPEVHWDLYTSAWILTGEDAYWGRVMEGALNQLAAPLARFAQGTSNIPDLRTQQFARTYIGNTHHAGFDRVPQGGASDPISGRAIVPDTPHWAAPQWEAYALSDHPYFLYSAQQFTNYMVWANRPDRRHALSSWKTWRDRPNYADPSVVVPDRLVVDSEQQRALGKGLMAALRMWQLTPEETPEWLLPKAYWAKIVRDTASHITDVYGQMPAWKLGLTERNYGPIQRTTQGDTAFDFMDLQVNWAVFACLYAGFDEYRPIADHITLTTGDILDALGAGHPSITKGSDPGNDVNFDSWREYAAFMRSNPDKFVASANGKTIQLAAIIGPRSIGTAYKWNEARVQGMTAAIWQLAKDNGDTSTQQAFAGFWRKYETARLHHNLYSKDKPYWSHGHWSTTLDWMLEGPDPSGEAQIYSEADMAKRGMINPL